MIRYALTFINSEGVRILAHENNGRNTWLTKEEGEYWLSQLFKTNPVERITSVFGENPKFEIRQVICRQNGEVTQTVFEN